MDVQEKTMELTVRAHLESLLTSYMKSYSVKAAIELGIADIIHSHGQTLTASQLAAEIPIGSSVDVSCLDRLMYFLVHNGVFAKEQSLTGEGEEVSYGLTPVSRLLLRDSPDSMSQLAMLSLHPLAVSSWDNLAAWFQSGEGYATAFEAKHGASFWTKASSDPAFNKIFNEAMSSSSKQVMGRIVEGCGEVFEGVSSLVDVGGGNGTVAAIIADAFPHIKCMVLDQPHVVAASSPPPNVVAIGGDMFESVPTADAVFLKGRSQTWPNVVAIGGDMFESVPTADAVFLKRTLHDWDDKECVKILGRCKEAIPKPGGKVIIADIVRKKWADQVSNELQLMLDLHMMVLHNGKERDEEEWKKLFIDAGFSNYKIVSTFGVHSLIEVFP